MKKQLPIIVDSEIGKTLGLTRELFDDAFCWDCRPAYLGFVRLRPNPERTEEALKTFFDAIDKIYSEVRITAPLPSVEDYATRRGFKKHVEPCGSTYVTDGEIKIARRQ